MSRFHGHLRSIFGLLSSLALSVTLAGLSFGCGDDDDGVGDGGTDGGTMIGRDGGPRPPRPDGGSSTGGTRNPVCEVATSAGEVRAPVFVQNLRGQTSWYASPVVADLDDDGQSELIAAYYDVFVFDDAGELLQTSR